MKSLFDWGKTMESRRNLIVVSVFKGISDHFAERVTYWILTSSLINMAFLLLADPSFFKVNPIYRFMACIAPAPVWGAYCLILGLIRVVALVVNGTFPKFRWSPHVRSILSALSCLVWLQFALGFIGDPVPGIGAAVYPFLLLLEIYNVYAAAIEAGRSFRVILTNRRVEETLTRMNIPHEVARMK